MQQGSTGTYGYGYPVLHRDEAGRSGRHGLTASAGSSKLMNRQPREIYGTGLATDPRYRTEYKSIRAK